MFQKTLEHTPENRAAFLKEVCAGDEELRQEAETLISYKQQAKIFMDTPALEAAVKDLHEGVIHRDIKPENIMLRPDGYTKVLDFGLAKLGERQVTADIEAIRINRVDTDPGTVMGTVSYMSPEQARGLAVDERTDIFSLGVIKKKIT